MLWLRGSIRDPPMPSTVSRPRITAIQPLWAVEGARITIEGTDLTSHGIGLPKCGWGHSWLAWCARRATPCRSSCRPISMAGTRRSVSAALWARPRSSRSVSPSLPACIRSITLPSIKGTCISPTAVRGVSSPRCRCFVSGATDFGNRSYPVLPTRHRWPLPPTGGCMSPAVLRDPSTVSSMMVRSK